jgi:hypothetical protein
VKWALKAEQNSNKRPRSKKATKIGRGEVVTPEERAAAAKNDGAQAGLFGELPSRQHRDDG